MSAQKASVEQTQSVAVSEIKEEGTAEKVRSKKNISNLKDLSGRAQKSLSDKEIINGVIAKDFDPSYLDFLKDNFGIDLESLDVSTVFDIRDGRVTRPLPITVTPRVYDSVKRETLDCRPVSAYCSLKFRWPYNASNGKKLPIDEQHRVFFSTYPCRPMMEAIQDEQEVVAEAPMVKEEDKTEGKVERVEFTPQQRFALAAVGVTPDRLFPGKFNSFSEEEKKEIAEGRPFLFDGVVETAAGFVNICGNARLTGNVAVFESARPIFKKDGLIPDLIGASRLGRLEINLFETDANGKKVLDESGMPVLNQAGKDLIRFGYSTVPVDGYSHTETYNKETGKFDKKVTHWKYTVSMVNGGLCATKMAKVLDKDKDGNPVLVTRNGEKVEKYHWEVGDIRMNENGVHVGIGKNGYDVEFATKADAENYRCGKGGVVKDAIWTDQQTKEKIKYDAFAVPDNQRGGFAKLFGPKISEMIIESRKNENRMKTFKVRKQNFSLGM